MPPLSALELDELAELDEPVAEAAELVLVEVVAPVVPALASVVDEVVESGAFESGDAFESESFARQRGAVLIVPIKRATRANLAGVMCVPHKF